MSIYYSSVLYTSTPETEQVIPVGGNHPLHFPHDEQRDPWKMHPRRHPDGHVIRDFLADQRAALFLPAVRGLATIQLDVVWTNGGTFTRRHNIVGEGQDYENNIHTRIDTDSWTSFLPVTPGEPFAVLVGHDSPNPQPIASARIQIAIQDDVAIPEEQRLRVRIGTDPTVEEDVEVPGEPGGSTPPVTDDDTILR